MNIYEHRWEGATWVCHDCGRKFGELGEAELTELVVTMHVDTCDVCQTPEVAVCHKRDYLFTFNWD